MVFCIIGVLRQNLISAYSKQKISTLYKDKEKKEIESIE